MSRRSKDNPTPATFRPSYLKPLDSRRIKHIQYASFKLFVKYEVHMVYIGYFGNLQKEGVVQS